MFKAQFSLLMEGFFLPKRIVLNLAVTDRPALKNMLSYGCKRCGIRGRSGA